jgi:beta-glucosidase-like glycosyl hydrolase
MYNTKAPVKSVIFGIGSEYLTKEEMRFFKETNPLGFILFSRNIKSRDQIRQLVRSLQDLLDTENLLILIDQEGGRVARLKPPLFMECPAAKFFRDIAENDKLSTAKKQLFKHAKTMGEELLELGINVNCAPVADIYYDYADKIIGDRSFGSDVNQVVELCKSMADGFIDAKVLPILKHIPGHGRADFDSHLTLPSVHTDIKTLMETDFKVFHDLKSYPLAMTAHICYSKIDSVPATLSKKTINFIRKEIGYKNALITDDLSMRALSGSLYNNGLLAIDAGCDILLHCNGILSEMYEVAKAAPFVDAKRSERFEKIFEIIL